MVTRRLYGLFHVLLLLLPWILSKSNFKSYCISVPKNFTTTLFQQFIQEISVCLYLRISFKAKTFWSIRHLSADLRTTTVITASFWTLFTFVRRIIAVLATIADFFPGNALTRQIAVESVACWIWKLFQ